MASLTLADAASRTAAMSDEIRKPKRWAPKKAEAAASAPADDGAKPSPALAKMVTALLHKHTTASKGSLYKNRD